MIEFQINAPNDMVVACPHCGEDAIYFVSNGYTGDESSGPTTRFHVECCICGIRTARMRSIDKSRNEWIDGNTLIIEKDTV